MGQKFECFIAGEGTLPRQCAEILLERGHAVCGIISPDPALRRWAAAGEIACLEPPGDLREFVGRQPFDYLFSIVNSSVLPDGVLALPRRGAINYHDGPLPRYAGVNATAWAIMRHEKQHGITWHLMTGQVDAGDILAQRMIDISPGDTTLLLNAKCYDAAVRSFAELVDELADGRSAARPQDLTSRSYFPLHQRPPAGCVLSWAQDAEEIAALVRGLEFGPYTNTLGLPKLFLGGDFVVVQGADVLDASSADPAGTLTSTSNDGFIVATATRQVVLRRFSTADGMPLPAAEAAARFGLRPGSRLAEITPRLGSLLTATDARLARHEAFWVRRLAALQPATLPYATPAVQRSAPLSGEASLTPLGRRATASQPIPEEVTGFLASDRPDWQAELFLLSAFAAFLARLTGNECYDIGWSSTELRRDLAGLEGFFSSVVPLSVAVDSGGRFDQLYDAIRSEVELIRRHQSYARDAMIRYPELAGRSDLPGRRPWPVMAELMEMPEPDRPALGSDLCLRIARGGIRPTARWIYNPDVLSENTIADIQEQFAVLLRDLATSPAGKPIRSLQLMTDTTRRRLLHEWNEPNSAWIRDRGGRDARCVHELFEAQAADTPGALAVIQPDAVPPASLTYAELNRRANQLARHLRMRGVVPETVVGLCVERSPDMILALLGILKAGGAYLPLDPALPRERLAFMLEDARVSLIVTQRELVAFLPQDRTNLVCLDVDWPAISQASDENLDAPADLQNLAYLIYTSGSTGMAKGVMIQHGSLQAFVQTAGAAYGIGPGDRVLQFASLSFDAAAEEIYPCLARGAALVLRADGMLDSTATFWQRCREWGLTVLDLPTAYWHELVAGSRAEPALPPSVRLVIIGGERALPERLREWQRHLGKGHVRLVNTYGPTEATVVATLHEVPAAGLGRAARAGSSPEVPIGRPLPNVQAYILDPHLQPVPVGVIGELHIGGAGLARGYLNRPDLTAEKFIPDPFSSQPGARLYRSGDLARYLADGRIEFAGRTDQQVKIRGFRVEPGEIEAVLNQHVAVHEAAVLAREDRPGQKRLVAYVVPATKPDVTTGAPARGSETTLTGERALEPGEPLPDELARALRYFLQTRLPEYMVPAAFVQLLAMPLTASGKIDRRALPAPDPGQVALAGRYVAPRTPIEGVLAAMWAELLGVARVGIDDNFFELGGHSLLATQFIARVKTVFRSELSLRDLFEKPTVAGVAALLAGNQVVEVRAIQPVERTGKLPASFAQRRLWFLDQLQPGSPAYNIPWTVHLSGPLDVSALEQSLSEVQRRHEILRTTFGVDAGQPVQVIRQATGFRLPVLDFSGSGGAPSAAQEFLARQARQPFDLAQGPLWRALLLRLATDEHLLFVVMHHSVADERSLTILNHELAALYRAFIERQPAPLPRLAIQYADFAQWQRRQVAGQALEKELAYWRRQLSGELPVLQLPASLPRPAVQTLQGATQRRVLSRSLALALRVLSRETGVTFFMTLLAAFQTLLYRSTGQTDVVCGSPVANRTRSEIERCIGFFVNTLVLRTDLSGNPTFRELLARVREVTLEAHAHQDLPFERLVEEVQPGRDLSHNPLFQVMFALEDATSAALELPGLVTSAWEVETGTAKFDLSLSIVDEANGLVVKAEYATDLFEGATIRRLLGQFETLLEDVVATQGQQRIAQLSLLTQTERRHLLIEWNDTRAPVPEGSYVHQLIERQAERRPESIALLAPAGMMGERLTYRELNRRANQLAHYLRSLGAGPEVPVGICMERSAEMVVGLLAILKAGSAYIPLDPSYPRDRLAFMLEDSGTSILLTQQEFRDQLCLGCRHIICLDSDWESIARQSDADLPNQVTGGNLAYVIYTSGSTGQPKGVGIPHGAFANFVLAMQNRPGLAPTDVLLAVTTLSFDIAGLELFLPLSIGARVVIASRDTTYEGVALAEELARSGATVMQATPATWRLLVQAGWRGDGRLKMLCGGEALPRELANQLRERGGSLWNMYGPTETTVWSAACQIKTPEGGVPIGSPIANTQIYILDAHLEPVPIGVQGELYIGGAGLARGYVNRPDLTARSFIPDPFSPQPGARLYGTGDLVRYRPDGSIEYLGRADHQVKVRGFRIELDEVEAALSGHPAVRAAAVVTQEREAGEKYLAAYLVPKEGRALLAREVRDYLTERLPGYMIPASFSFLEAFPLTPNGKLDRRALRPSTAISAERPGYRPPGSLIEKLLANIWADLLGIEQIGIHDDFFELGGHSLLAARLVLHIRETFQVGLLLRDFFTTPTIAGLAQAIQAAGRPGPADGPAEPDLRTEAVLDPTIHLAAATPARPAGPAAVLLTGATGFLGSFLLYELLEQTQADIFCLVRAASIAEGRQKIRQTFGSFFLAHPESGARVIPVLGDLARPHLGLGEAQFRELARGVETIYHNGAMTNLVYPYARLKPANVQGIQEILRLASLGGGTPVHYISTISVFDSPYYMNEAKRVILEAEEPAYSPGLFNGYAQSKWVAEKLAIAARTRGLSVTIYRPGAVVGDTRTGAWNTQDYWCRFIKGCVQLGSMPKLDEMTRLAPVDFVSRAIVHLSRQRESQDKTFHVLNPQRLPLSQIASWLRAAGYALEDIPYDRWLSRLIQSTENAVENALHPLLPFFLERVPTAEQFTIPEMYTQDKEPRYDWRHLTAGLAGTSLACPPVDAKLFAIYLAYLIHSGFLEAPASGQRAGDPPSTTRQRGNKR